MTKTNTTTATPSIIDEQLTALRTVMTGAVGRQMMRKLLGDQYSAAQSVIMAASVSAIAMQSDPASIHGAFLRLISKGLCAQATSDVCDVVTSVITPSGDVKDAAVHKEACNELCSVFADLEATADDPSRFSTQQDRVLEATPEQAKVLDTPTEPAKKHMPAGHQECEKCHMPGKKTKGSVLRLKRPELMPDEIVELDGKWLCPKCLNAVNEIIRKAIKDAEAAEAAAKKATEDEAKAQAERDAAEAERKFNLDKLVELRAQEEELAKELAKCETYAECAPASMKEMAEKTVQEVRTSLGNIRENISSIESLLNGGTEVHTVPAPAATPSVAKKLTKKERKALRKASSK